MKLIIASVCLLVGCNSEENLGFSVVGSPRWGVALGGRADDRGMNVAFDSTGDVIVGGDYTGPADFGSGLDTVGGAAFLTKRFASDGSEAWTVKLLPQSSTSGAYIADIAIGGQDTIIVVGDYWGTVNFGDGTTLAQPPSLSTMFLATYAADGHLLWVTDLNDFAQASAVAVDHVGRIYITGTFWRSTLNFNGQVFQESDNEADTFVAAFDAQGTVLWGTAYQAAAPGTISGAGPWASDIAVTATGDVIVTGSFYAPVPFGTTTLQPDARSRSFVTRHHADGSFVAAQVIGPTAPFASFSPRIVVDANGHIVIQQTETDESMTGPQAWEHMSPATLHVFDDAMHELWTSRLQNHGALSPQPRTLTSTPAGLIVSSAWTDMPQLTQPDDLSTEPGWMEVAAFDADGTSGIDTFGNRVYAAPQSTLAFGSAASSTGALAFTGAFAGKVDFGMGPVATHGQGDLEIYIVVVDPPAN